MADAVIKKPTPLALDTKLEKRMGELVKAVRISGWQRLQLGECIDLASGGGVNIGDVYSHIAKRYRWSLSRIQNLRRAARAAKALEGDINIYAQSSGKRRIASDLVALPLAPYLRTKEDVKKYKDEILKVLDVAEKTAEKEGVEIGERHVKTAVANSAKLQRESKAPPFGRQVKAAAKAVESAVKSARSSSGIGDYANEIGDVVLGATALNEMLGTPSTPQQPGETSVARDNDKASDDGTEILDKAGTELRGFALSIASKWSEEEFLPVLRAARRYAAIYPSPKIHVLECKKEWLESPEAPSPTKIKDDGTTPRWKKLKELLDELKAELGVQHPKMLLGGEQCALTGGNLSKMLNRLPPEEACLVPKNRLPEGVEPDYWNQKDGAGFKMSWQMTDRLPELLLRSLAHYNNVEIKREWKYPLPELTDDSNSDMRQMMTRSIDEPF